MTIELGDLSFESGALAEEEGKPDAAIQGEVPNPVFEKGFDDMMLVFETYETITTRKYICRSDMERIKELSGTYPALGKLIKKYPINSFTADPSRVNFDASTEGFIATAYQAVVKTLGDVIQYIIEAVGKLWDFLTMSGQRTAQVDGMDGKLRSIQSYIIEVDNILSSSKFAEDYRKVKAGAINNEFHNLTKKWNGFKDQQLKNPADLLSDINTISGAMKIKLPPFVDAVESFLIELTKAETEQDVINAVAKMELLDMTSAQLVKMAAGNGYSRNAVKRDDKMTEFHALAVYIRNVYRSSINDRKDIDRAAFTTAITEYTIDSWAEGIIETISWAKGRTNPVLAKLKAFNSDGLKPGLGDTYRDTLVPFFKALTSILAGFTALEQSMGMLTDNRNNVVIGMAKASLSIAKRIDQFVLSNQDGLTMAQRNVIWRQRKALSASFS